jgi:hypothetical protein
MKISFKRWFTSERSQIPRQFTFSEKVFIWWYLSISSPQSFEKLDLKVQFRSKSKSLTF